MRFTLRWIFLVVLCFCSTVAAEEAIPPPGSNSDPTVTAQGSTVHYTGLLNKIGLERLRRLLEQHQALRELRINSSGGDALPSIEMGELIRGRGLSIVVDSRCNSACANYVFVPAAKKTIAAGSMVMWHNACPQNIPGGTKFTNVLHGEVANVGAAIYVNGRPLGDKEKAEVLEKNSRKLGRRLEQYYSEVADRQLAFFADMPIDSRVVCLGDYIDLPKGNGYAYTMSIEDMGKFGVCNVTANENYLAQVVAALAREGKSDLGGVIRMSDYPDFKPHYAQTGCADAQTNGKSEQRGRR